MKTAVVSNTVFAMLMWHCRGAVIIVVSSIYTAFISQDLD